MKTGGRCIDPLPGCFLKEKLLHHKKSLRSGHFASHAQLHGVGTIFKRGQSQRLRMCTGTLVGVEQHSHLTAREVDQD